MNFVPKNPVEAVLAEVLAAIEQPAWVVDVDRGLVVAANGRGDAVWGTPTMVPALNGATLPALKALRARLNARPLSSQLRSAAGAVAHESIQFSTFAGLRAVPCAVRRLDDRAGPAMLLLVAQAGAATPVDPADRGPGDVSAFVERWLSGARSAGRTGPRVTMPADADAGAPLSDAETLREIARRIRQGAAGLMRQDFDDDVDRAAPDVAAQRAPAPIANDAGIDISTHLAHEIRTPLAAIISLAEVITEERLGTWPNERYRSYIHDILESARHGLEVVDAILREAPGEQPGAPAATAEVDLNVEVEGLCASLQPLAGKSGARLEAALVTGLPRVAADRRNVRQMLLNLISNAIKHGGDAVRIKVTTGYELGGEAWVEVEDDGPGMTVADAGSPAQGIGSDGRPRKAGLGLRLTRTLATANGAHLELSSRPGRGVRARIVFGGTGALPTGD